MNGFDVCETNIFNYAFYAGNMFLVLLNKMNLTGPPGSKLITYAAGPGEKIQHIYCFEINTVVQDVKKALPGKVGRGPGFETGRRNKPPAPVFAADYPQLVMVKRLMNL